MTPKTTNSWIVTSLITLALSGVAATSYTVTTANRSDRNAIDIEKVEVQHNEDVRILRTEFQNEIRAMRSEQYQMAEKIYQELKDLRKELQ